MPAADTAPHYQAADAGINAREIANYNRNSMRFATLNARPTGKMIGFKQCEVSALPLPRSQPCDGVPLRQLGPRP